jgi:hypothetical protein
VHGDAAFRFHSADRSLSISNPLLSLDAPDRYYFGRGRQDGREDYFGIVGRGDLEDNLEMHTPGLTPAETMSRLPHAYGHNITEHQSGKRGTGCMHAFACAGSVVNLTGAVKHPLSVCFDIYPLSTYVPDVRCPMLTTSLTVPTALHFNLASTPSHGIKLRFPFCGLSGLSLP